MWQQEWLIQEMTSLVQKTYSLNCIFLLHLIGDLSHKTITVFKANWCNLTVKFWMNLQYWRQFGNGHEMWCTWSYSADFYQMIQSNIQSSRDQCPWCNYAKLFRCFSYRGGKKKLLGKWMMCCDQMYSLTSTEGWENDELLAAYDCKRVEAERVITVIQKYDFKFKLEIWKNKIKIQALWVRQNTEREIKNPTVSETLISPPLSSTIIALELKIILKTNIPPLLNSSQK